MAIRAILLRAFGGLAALAAAATTANAQNPICTNLEARLAQLQNPSAAPGGNPRLDQSIERQRIELSQARNEARRVNCTGGFLFFQGPRHPKCGVLMQTIGQMEHNLARMEAERDRSRRQGQGSPAEVQNVLRLLANNRCGPQYARYGGSGWSNDSGGFFGPRSWWNGGPFSGRGQAPRVNTFRTLCVRTCDGYYFPISFSTVNSRFVDDEATCRSMCPGTDVRLYYHRNPGEESEQMVSLAGEPYTALPTAFLYRDHYIDACSCGRPAADYAALGEQPATIAGVPIETEVRRFVPVPVPRPVRSADPETVANRQGEFVPEAPEPRVPGAVAELTGPDGKRVRVVGPSYYYAQ